MQMATHRPNNDLARPTLSKPKRGLPPIANAKASVLILGTLPGDESLLRQQYYGHPRNHFWSLIAALAGEPPPESYAARVALLLKSGFALWDVLASAERDGSLDSAIRNAKPNDFAAFFRTHPRIDTIAFNGQRAHALFRAHVADDPRIASRRFTMLVLPSSSPAYVKPLDDKVRHWRAALAK
jgi:TDG/mug DNA glycosylase family protein